MLRATTRHSYARLLALHRCCAFCGYPLADLPGERCPECGRNRVDARGDLLRQLLVQRPVLRVGLSVATVAACVGVISFFVFYQGSSGSQIAGMIRRAAGWATFRTGPSVMHPFLLIPESRPLMLTVPSGTVIVEVMAGPCPGDWVPRAKARANDDADYTELAPSSTGQSPWQREIGMIKSFSLWQDATILVECRPYGQFAKDQYFRVFVNDLDVLSSTTINDTAE